MFEETDDAFIWRCNACGLRANFPPHDFWRALSELKARGWKIERGQEPGEEDDWVHYCRKCHRARSASNVAALLDRKPRANRG
jgi:hypothetical protein